MRGQSGHNTQPDTRLPPIFLGMDAWMISQMNVALTRGSLMCLACVFDVLAMNVFTIRQWRTAGRLVQELDVCTVLTVSRIPRGGATWVGVPPGGGLIRLDHIFQQGVTDKTILESANHGSYFTR